MNNALDYLDWRGDLSFRISKFNEIDLFLCSQLSTPVYTGIVANDGSSVKLGEVVKMYFASNIDDVSTLGVLQSSYVLPMLRALPKTKRFKNAKLCFAVNHVDQENIEQFSAVTIELPDGSICVAYRGTDDTIIGWKEDFNLATHEAVPAQKDALDYLVNVAQNHEGQIHICGHSKGGNLAVYAAVKAPSAIKDRIVEVCSFDGPGFSAAFLESEDYLEMKSRIRTVLSQNSLVGTLLNTAGKVEYVTSTKSGPLAHDGFSWIVKGTSFVRSSGLGDVSKAFDKAMGEALDKMSVDEKQEFVDELFDTLTSTGAVTITDLTNIKLSSALALFKNFWDDKKVHSFNHKVGEELFKAIYTPLLNKLPFIDSKDSDSK